MKFPMMQSVVEVILLVALLATSCHAAAAPSFDAHRPRTTSVLSLQQIPRGGARATPNKNAAATSSPSQAVVRRGKKVPVSGGTATPTSLVVNLVKGIVGVTVLSLPAGIASFGNSPSVLIPALALIAGIGMLSAYGFAVIGKVCAYTGAQSYREAWSQSVGERSSWIPAGSIAFKTSFACLAISMVLADTFTGLLQRSPDERTAVLVGLTLTILLPLCWMKNLASLAPFSLVGILGMAYTAVAMTIRYLDGSYGVGGALSEQVAENLRPAFGDAGWKSVMQPNSLLLVCMLSTAYMAHFFAPKVYQELQNNTLPRFYAVVGSTFGISISLMGFITAIGFLTFGSSASGVILNNYASKDMLMSLSKIAVAVSLVFSYPLMFQGCRDGILDLLKVSPEKRSNSFLNITTVCMLATITLLAAVLKDVSLVIALGGATLGNALTYLYPAIMYNATVKKQKREGESLGLFVSNVCAVLGVAMGVVGTKMALEK